MIDRKDTGTCPGKVFCTEQVQRWIKLCDRRPGIFPKAARPVKQDVAHQPNDHFPWVGILWVVRTVSLHRLQPKSVRAG